MSTTSTMTTSTRTTTLSRAPLPVSSSPATSTKKSMTASTDEFVQDNPELVQPENWRMMNNWSGRTPVFLIHDGGGTTFAYHCLDPLNRFTYGIRNPYFFSQKKFEDGIPEMAQLYANWIKAEVAKDSFPAKNKGETPVEIMLGGWSLGGLLSLEVAHVLAEDLDVRIKGILMIDSVCPNELRRSATSNAMGSESEEGKTKNQILSSRSLTEARRMVGEWTMPRWDGHLLGKRPRMMLLKCRESVPLANGSKSVLDIDRADTDLGWEWYDRTLFEEVVPIDGHHFSIFEQVNIPTVTKTIRSSLIKLDAF